MIPCRYQIAYYISIILPLLLSPLGMNSYCPGAVCPGPGAARRGARVARTLKATAAAVGPGGRGGRGGDVSSSIPLQIESENPNERNSKNRDSTGCLP